jgi:hypothetical protein
MGTRYGSRHLRHRISRTHLELQRETLLDWFRRAVRNPSVPDDILKVLTDNGYLVDTVVLRASVASEISTVSSQCSEKTIQRVGTSF